MSINIPGKVKYLVNMVESHLQMMDNRLTIKRGEHAQISEKESEHEDVIFAIRRGWAKLMDIAPTESATAPAPEMKFTKPANEGASSIEELLAQDTKVPADEAKVDEVKVTPVTATEAEAPVAEAATATDADAKPAKGTKAKA
jgi:hypothetical protein